MSHIGNVKNWNEERGFGFLKRVDGGADVLVHAFEVRRAHIQGFDTGTRVHFDTKPGPPGKAPVACDLRLEDANTKGASLIEQVFKR